MQTHIYLLKDSDGKIRYVGKTVRPLRIRLRSHIYSATHLGEKFHSHCWIRQMINSGASPTIHLLETVDGDGGDRERFWIAHHRHNGDQLTNTTDGGEGVCGLKHSKETREAWSRNRTGKQIGRHVSDTTREALSVALTGRVLSKESRRKISASLSGRHLKEETKAKLRVAMIGRKFTDQWKKRISNAVRGRKFSAETIEKMRSAKLGKPLSYRHRMKIGNALRGRKFTEEHKLNMSLSKRNNPGAFPMPPIICV